MDDNDASLYSSLRVESYDTALCLVPPQETWGPIDRFRALNDKGYGKWPPHINLIYPFVPVNVLDKAAQLLSALNYDDILPLRLSLTEADSFRHKHDNTIHIRPGGDACQQALATLMTRLSDALGRTERKPYRPHMTVAQSFDSNSDAHDFLLDKARLLTPFTWEASSLAILVRHKHGDGEDGARIMRLWGTIPSSTGDFSREQSHAEYYMRSLGREAHVTTTPVRSQAAFGFSKGIGSWVQLCSTSQESVAFSKGLPESVSRVIIASYNVLAEFEWPPVSTRYPHLVRNICSNRALADILVLQEVTDPFLDHLLGDPTVQEHYPFATHGRPSDERVGPLPSLLNVVVLSKYPMQWEYLEHSRKHKGSAIVIFPTIRVRQADGTESAPLVLAACHLSQGLTDGSVSAKKQEVQDLVKHLSQFYHRHPLVIAGDFNLTTSSFTIGMARKKGALSSHALQNLRDIDSLLLDHGFRDVWLDTRLESGESSGVRFAQENLGQLHEGEQGATFDPQINTLAAKQTGFGLNTRPQRYDRFFVGESTGLRPSGFNMFGQETAKTSEGGISQHASDHWGVRCLLQAEASKSNLGSDSAPTKPVGLWRASPSLGGLEDLIACLSKRDMVPTPEDETLRAGAIEVLRRVLIDEMVNQSQVDSQFKPSLVLVPVGSTALGIWTPSSDVDCLCVGGISSKTFFTLALKRLRKAAAEGISVVRKVRANSGTMLELLVRGIRFDLQYCPAISIAEQYPEVFNRPSTDEAFSLPMQTLLKLKPARDLSYLRRSIPDMTQYRAAHLLIKAWAISRGIYAAKFGFIGGIHLSVLLVPICKSLARAGHNPNVSDIVTTFFHHYATFDWDKHMVFDPFFHKQTKYHRSFREPLCLLGWHTPSLNTAATASVPTVRTLTAELIRADQLLSNTNLSWDEFLGGVHGEVDFLSRYQRYVQINIHYWGQSPSKGNRLVGWVESRCAMLLVDLDRRVPNLSPRIWPERFISKAKQDSNQVTECQGCYLIGVERAESPAGAPSLDAEAIEGTLIAVLHDFEAKLKADETYYDPQYCWLNLTLQRASELGDLQADRTSWGVRLPGQDQWTDDFDSEDEELSDAEQETNDSEQFAVSVTPRPKNRVSAGGSKAAKHSFSGLGKFRTATDVLNRLRWDPAMDSGDFIVGYEDRFTGAQEKALDKWKSDLTHEEFIPQHRILYFKRRSDGIKVWERSTRTDKVFGSGVRS
ncbi:hypothetical protein NLU13_4957 [Sarocladium strictum]|uniref:polynucleotide adenylyltransferase n=1 Tax=Sarocladium strictum TaxID=5046 RepID=A0AA39L9E1_SARSR|nr:hypothetical protein NLU13_4957 [Sarocladium strictum]